MGMEERADFGQNMILVFLRDIHIFFGVKYCVGPRVIFLEFIFFAFAKVCFKKQQKKHSRIRRLKIS